jgi:hypothetical protein
MKANKIDQLFREKLDAHEVQPSAQAWEQLQARLGHKKTPVVVWFYRVAAAVVIFGVVGYLVFRTDNPTANDLADVKRPAETNVVQPEVENPQENQDETTLPVEQKQEQVIEKPIKKQSDKKETPAQTLPAQTELVAHVDVPEKATVVETPEVNTPEVEATEKPISIAPIQIKYVASVISEEPKEKEERSVLGKIWDKAKDLKEGGEVLASIRETKNNFLERKQTQTQNQNSK